MSTVPPAVRLWVVRHCLSPPRLSRPTGDRGEGEKVPRGPRDAAARPPPLSIQWREGGKSKAQDRNGASVAQELCEIFGVLCRSFARATGSEHLISPRFRDVPQLFVLSE